MNKFKNILAGIGLTLLTLGVTVAWTAQAHAFTTGIEAPRGEFGSDWQLVNIPPPQADITTPEYKICKMMRADFIRIYDLFLEGLPEIVTHEIVVQQDGLHPVLQYPLHIAVGVLYSMTVDQHRLLTKNWWVSQAVAGCSEIIGVPYEDDRYHSPTYRDGRRWIEQH